MKKKLTWKMLMLYVVVFFVASILVGKLAPITDYPLREIFRSLSLALLLGTFITFVVAIIEVIKGATHK